MKKPIVALAALLFLCSAAFAQPKLKVVVEAVGAEPAGKPNTLKIVEAKVQEAFVRDGRFTAVARGEDLNRIDKEHVYQRSGAVDDKQIAELGRRYGARYICTVKSSQVLESFMLEASLIDIETAGIIGAGSAPCDLVSIGDLAAASGELVRQLLNPGGAGGKGGYGSGLYWDREAVGGGTNPMSAALANILKQKVAVSEGTCVSGTKIAIESDLEPACSEGMVGITCKVNATLVVTQCQSNRKTVLKGSVTGADKASKDAAVKQVMRNVETATFWDAWVMDLEAKGGK